MSPEEDSTLTLLAGVPEDFDDIRDELLESLSGEAYKVGKVLCTSPDERAEFDESSREAAERFERWGPTDG